MKNIFKREVLLAFFILCLLTACSADDFEVVDADGPMSDNLSELKQLAFEGIKQSNNAPEDSGKEFEIDEETGKLVAKNSGVTVTKVVDGDTIEVDIHGQKDTVRFIGVDATEFDYEDGQHDCFAQEATDRVKELIGDKQITLQSDPTQADRDKYERLLRYVILADGRNLNKELINDGYAYEYTYDEPYKFQKDFKKAQKSAKKEDRGLWAKGACD